MVGDILRIADAVTSNTIDRYNFETLRLARTAAHSLAANLAAMRCGKGEANGGARAALAHIALSDQPGGAGGVCAVDDKHPVLQVAGGVHAQQPPVVGPDPQETVVVLPDGTHAAAGDRGVRGGRRRKMKGRSGERPSLA